MRSLVKRTAKLFGLEVRKFRAPLEIKHEMNLFDLCGLDLSRKLSRPYVLQIGANDGAPDDPIHHFIYNQNWRGVLIEPHPSTFLTLTKTYANFRDVKTKNIAISDRDGTVTLYVPNSALAAQNPRLHRLCSLSREQISREFEFLKIPDENIEESSVETRTVASLLRDEAILQIDVLQIDAEAYDWRILSQFDLKELNVKLLNVEFHNLSPKEQRDCVAMLNALDYQIGFFMGNLVAYRPSL